VIVTDGQPGVYSPVGDNFFRAAMTARADAEASGLSVRYYGPTTGFDGFQNLLNTAAELGTATIEIFTHGDSNRLLLGDGDPNDQNSITMTNVGKLVNKSTSLTVIHIYGCKAGFKENGIAAALAKQLNVLVFASTTGMSFSSYPNRLTGAKIHPSTGPTYMVPEGKGIMKRFAPPGW